MKQLGCISVLILVATACGIGGKHRTEIEANEVTVQSIQKFTAALEEFDIHTVNETRNNRLERLQAIEAALKTKGDTLSAREAEAMADLSAEGEPYHPFSVEIGTVTAKLRRSQAGLEALNHDLKYNLLPVDSVRYMVNHERRFAHQVLAEAEKILDTTPDETAISVEWHEKADSLEQDLIKAQK
jgi:3-methyladenine DNA glycosylase Tag